MAQTTPRSIALPPVRVEPQLQRALAAIAAKEGRTVSDVIRTYLREAMAERARVGR